MRKLQPSTETMIYGQVVDVIAEAICPVTGVLDLEKHQDQIVKTRNNLILKENITNETFTAMMGEAIRHVWDVRMELNVLGPEGANA